MEDVFHNDQHRNNFDLLRFVLAFTVLLFHLSALSGKPVLGSFSAVPNGNFAVLGFFAISGYVVTLSWHRSSSWKDYMERRFRRILPGYLAVVLFWWVAGSVISTLPIFDYWASAETWRYLAANLVFLQFLAPVLPKVFANNPAGPAVNGALWSIRSELLCYLLLPLVLRIRFLLPGALLCGTVAAMLYRFEVDRIWLGQLRVGVAQPMEAFLIGVWIASTSNSPRLRQWNALAWGGIAGLLLLVGPDFKLGANFYHSPWWFALVMPAATAFLVLAAALAIPFLGNWSVLGNVSYGIYLWHFPIIQLFVNKGWFKASPSLFTTAIIPVVIAAAILSWTFVERPFLEARKKFFRLPETPQVHAET